MRIKNPIKENIEVIIKGIPYFLPSEGILENVPEEHARYWQESLHKFIQLEKDKVAVVKEEVTEKIIEKKEEEKEEVKAEVVEPAKVSISKSKK